MLEEENQRLQKEIENQQAVVEMLITNDKCTDKSKNNTNIAAAVSVSPEDSSVVGLQNRFDNLIVTEVNQIEIHDSQDHTPSSRHKRCKITNTVIRTTFVHLMQ